MRSAPVTQAGLVLLAALALLAPAAATAAEAEHAPPAAHPAAGASATPAPLPTAGAGVGAPPAEPKPIPPPPEVRGPALPIPPRAEGPKTPAAEAEGTPPAPPAVDDHAAGAAPTGPADAGHPPMPKPAGQAAHPAPPAQAAGPAADAHAGERATKEAEVLPGEAAAAAAQAAKVIGKPKRSRDLRETSVPPSLTGKALAEELRRSAGGRASDKESQAAERARLEKLSKEIADARAALKAETAKLQELVLQAAKAPDPKAKAPAKPGTKPQPTAMEGLARTVKGMKPDQAAALLGRLDKSLAAGLLERMKPAEAAVVLEKMDSSTSAALVALLARKEAP